MCLNNLVSCTCSFLSLIYFHLKYIPLLNWGNPTCHLAARRRIQKEFQSNITVICMSLYISTVSICTYNTLYLMYCTIHFSTLHNVYSNHVYYITPCVLYTPPCVNSIMCISLHMYAHPCLCIRWTITRLATQWIYPQPMFVVRTVIFSMYYSASKQGGRRSTTERIAP